METAFLTTEGPLEDRLMAALEAANVPGADTRCMSCSKPAISSFIRVARPDNPSYLFLEVPDTECDENPIDSLWVLYNDWIALRYPDAALSAAEIAPSIIPAGCPGQAELTITPKNHDNQPPSNGVEDVTVTNIGSGVISPVTDNGDGTFSVHITAPAIAETDIFTIEITAGGETVEIDPHPSLEYKLLADADGDDAVNILDVVFLINYMYKNGPTPEPVEFSDVNNDTFINILDVVYIINYLYKNGPEPVCP
jgi:hypothetical protein